MAKDVKKTTDAQVTDMLLDDFDKFEHFTVTYLKQIIIACVVIIVIVAIGVIGYSIHSAGEKKADSAIANAKTAEELQKVIKEYSGRKAVWGAYQKLIKIYLEKKDFSKALEANQSLLKLNVPEEMRWPLELNAGYMMEIMDKKADAINKFVAISKDNYFPPNVRIEASYSAGRLEAARGNKVAAKSYLEAAAKNQMAAAGEGSLWQKLAMAMLMNLDKPQQDTAKAAAPAPAAAPAKAKTAPAPAKK